MIDQEATMLAPSLEKLFREANPELPRFVGPHRARVACGPWTRGSILAFWAFKGNHRLVVTAIPCMLRRFLESLASFCAGIVLECFVIDAVVDSLPGKARSPERKFTIANAVLEVVPWVEHEGMPNHDNVYLQLASLYFVR